MARERIFALGLAVVACASSIGCAAQGTHYDDRDWTKEHGIQTGAWREVENLFDAESDDVDKYNSTPRGVRHDLTFAKNAVADTRCHCLDVVIGVPSDPRFSWAGVRPKISENHIAVAIRTDGSTCSLPAGTTRRPSIQAVDVVGHDVIIVIEELEFDRPQALGAVIQKPYPDGHLWVQPRVYKNRVLPYARGTGNQATRCLIKTDKREHHLNIRSGQHF
jgi:hypothetical protein